MPRPAGLLPWAFISLGLIAFVAAAAAQPTVADLATLAPLATSTRRADQSPSLTWSLDVLAKRAGAAKAANPAQGVAVAFATAPELAAMREAGLVRTDGDRVQVWAWAKGDAEAATALLRSLGVEVERQDTARKLLQAWVPVSALPAL